MLVGARECCQNSVSSPFSQGKWQSVGVDKASESDKDNRLANCLSWKTELFLLLVVAQDK